MCNGDAKGGGSHSSCLGLVPPGPDTYTAPPVGVSSSSDRLAPGGRSTA